MITYTNTYMHVVIYYLGWKDSGRVHAVRDEIVHSCEPHVRTLLARHFMLPPREVRLMRSTLAYHAYFPVYLTFSVPC